MFDNIIFKYIITFLTGVAPILEIRGAIPFGVGLGLSYIEAFVLGFVGNIIPIFFIVKFARPLFDFFGKVKLFKKIIDFATNKATKKIAESPKLQNYTLWGLFFFVAIPIPTTGAWVGSLIANFLNIPLKKAFFPLAAGVFVAGIIVLALVVIAQGSFAVLF